MVTKADAPKLLDVMTRHQVYLESLKVPYGKEFDAVMMALRQDLREAFFSLEVDKLSMLTKRELEKFIRKLKTAQYAHFSSFTQQVLNDLKKFMEVDAQMHVTVLRETQEEDKKKLGLIAAWLTGKGSKTLWASILAQRIQANGLTPEEFLKRFADSAVFATESVIRRAHANKDTARATLTALIGTSRLLNRDGVLLRLIPQSKGLIGTLLQHATGVVQGEIYPAYFDRYEYVAVLDSRTSEICRSRHGRIYTFGDGPIPPAHVNCRSRIVPLDDGEDSNVPTDYAAWFKRQPEDVRRDIGGDGTKFKTTSSLTLKEFAAKIKNILAI